MTTQWRQSRSTRKSLLRRTRNGGTERTEKERKEEEKRKSEKEKQKEKKDIKTKPVNNLIWMRRW